MINKNNTPLPYPLAKIINRFRLLGIAIFFLGCIACLTIDDNFSLKTLLLPSLLAMSFFTYSLYYEKIVCKNYYVKNGVCIQSNSNAKFGNQFKKRYANNCIVLIDNQKVILPLVKNSEIIEAGTKINLYFYGKEDNKKNISLISDILTYEIVEYPKKYNN